MVLFAAAACGGDDAAVRDDALSPVSSTMATASSTSTAAPAATSTTAEPRAPVIGTDECAHVIEAEIEFRDDGLADVSATVRSADTGWEKYADAWVVRGPEGVVLGERVLAHPHETEQPFIRSLRGVSIPEDVTEVEIAARDSVVGFCGDTLTVAVERP